MTTETINNLINQVDNLGTAYGDLANRLDVMDDGNLHLLSYRIAKLLNTDHQDLLNAIGKKIDTFALGTANVNLPTGLRVSSSGQLEVVSYYRTLNRYSQEYAIDYIYPTPYGNPTASNELMGYSMGFDVNEASGDYAIASWARHIVRVYKSDGSLRFTIGVPAGAGNLSQGRLRYPKTVKYLPNGNLLVCSYLGYAVGANDHGHLTEYDGQTGELVATRLYCHSGKYSLVGTNIINRPTALTFDKNDSNYMYAVEYLRGRIVKINITTWLVEEVYIAPADYDFGEPWGVASLSDGNLALAARKRGMIFIIDGQTKDVIGEIDPTRYGSSGDFRDVIELEPGKLAFSDWMKRAVYVAPINDVVEVAYELPPIPDDAVIDDDVALSNFDYTTGILSQPIQAAELIPNKIAINYSRTVY